MRITTLFQILALSLLWQTMVQASDLIQQVPASSPAYAQLRLLQQRGMLSAGREALLAGVPGRLLARYDCALLLIEPLERINAMVEAQEMPALTPEQVRRKELGALSFAPLAKAEKGELLSAVERLLQEFRADVEELTPGLPLRAASALQKLRVQLARAAAPSDTVTDPTYSFMLSPRGAPDTLAGPLPLLSPVRSETPAAEPIALTRFNAQTTPLLGTLPVTALEAAVDIAFNRFRVYGSLSAAPGQDIMQWINERGSGTYKFGVWVDLRHAKDFDISGILEYHFQRTPETSNTTDANTGAVGGIGVRW